MHEQCLCDGVGKIADQFQSYHQEGGTLLVFYVDLSCLGQLATFDRVRIVALCQEGLSSREVSRRLRVNQSDIVRKCRRYRDTETVDNMRRSVRPKATTAVDDRYLRILARRNSERNATMLNNAFRAATGRRVSTQTARNRLHDVQLHSRRSWRGPHLTPRHYTARYRWAQLHA